MTAQKAFPSLLSAILLTIVAFATTIVWHLVALDLVHPAVAGALAIAAGPGLVGVLAVHQIQPPRGKRLGIRGFPPRFVLPIALLLPVIVVGMEVQALVRMAFAAPGAAGVYEGIPGLINSDSASRLIISFFLFAVFFPVMVEWFFRGVVQQGLAERFGALNGILLTATFYALALTGLRSSLSTWVAMAITTFGWGVVFGLLRTLTGSLLAPILLHAGLNFIWVLGIALSESAPVQAFTIPGKHVPIVPLIPSILSVAAGLFLIRLAARQGSSSLPHS